MSRAHVDALLTILATATGLTVHDNEAPAKAVPPYLVLRTDDGVSERTSMNPLSDKVVTTFDTLSVGVDRNQAQWASAKGLNVLLDARPSISGRSCSPIEQLTSRPTERDDDFTPPVFYAVNRFQFISIPS